jgi:hypothetical protein
VQQVLLEGQVHQVKTEAALVFQHLAQLVAVETPEMVGQVVALITVILQEQEHQAKATLVAQAY